MLTNIPAESSGARRRDLGDLFERAGWRVPAFVLGVSALVLAAALLSQFLGHSRPCVLCISQRYPYVIAIILGLVSVIFYTNVLVRVLMLAVITIAFIYGAAMGVFHVGVDWGLWTGAESCGATIIGQYRTAPIAVATPGLDLRCDDVAWSLFGISMAGYNVLMSGFLAVVSASATWFGFSREA